MEYLRYNPRAIWILDTGTSFADMSSYGNTATLTGSSTRGISLSSKAAYSQVVNSTNYISFPQDVYISGKQRQDFSLVASVFLPDTGSFVAQQILSNLSRTDGLSINGNVVSFSTDYASTGSATVSTTVPVGQKLDIVGVHTSTQNILFINGEYVDSIDILSTQQADVYATTNGVLYAGRQSAQNLLINMVAIYPRGLAGEEVANMYQDNSQISVTDPIKAYRGQAIEVSILTRPAYLNIKWDTEQDWEDATLQGVFVDDNILRPQMLDTVTMQGYWLDSINLYNGEVISTINSLNLYWFGLNVTVEVSTDGIAWETVTKGVSVATIPAGFDPTGKALFIRVTFASGVTEAYIEDLTVRAYLTNTSQQPNGRVITWTNPAVTFESQKPYLLLDDWGTKVLGGSLDIGTDTSSTTPMTVKTIEVWVKQLTGTAPTYSSNLTTGTTAYTNGVAGSTIRRGEWSVQHFTKSTAITGNITFSGNVQIGRVVLYDTQLSATQVSNLYLDYIGTLLTNRSSGGSIAVAEHSPLATIYGHDWSTTA